MLKKATGIRSVAGSDAESLAIETTEDLFTK
jgi:hypothetical protein